MWTLALPRVNTRSFATLLVRRNIPFMSRIGTVRGRPTQRSFARVKRHGDRCPYVAVMLTPRGGSAAQPTYPPPYRHATQAGPHIVPGTQAQPKPDTRIQRP